MPRTCVPSGYMYEFQGKRQWRRTSSEKWDTVVKKNMCGRKVGERTIDGHRVVVVKVRGKFYAALPQYIKQV